MKVKLHLEVVEPEIDFSKMANFQVSTTLDPTVVIGDNQKRGCVAGKKPVFFINFLTVKIKTLAWAAKPYKES